MNNRKQRDYKSIYSSLNRELQKDLEENMEKFRDPTVMGEMVYLLLRERENTNRILKTILERLDRIERMLSRAEIESGDETIEGLLPEIDAKILDYIKKKKIVTATDVKREFGYKGTNAASARLNRLFTMGYLKKKQVGRKVYYTIA
ncbi:hypothetical protein J7K41_00295 [Candidatus Micrarchaeota archaeon]|nr:hypothetical protein [Candidatus Micrarchaeota archaeon]